MSITPQVYAKARAEIIALFGWSSDSLSPDQSLRVDCACALRLALDDLQGRVVRGETIDIARMLSASEALSRLLPPSALASPPSEQREDPRQVMFKIYMEMRERGDLPPAGWHQCRINELEAEIAALKAGSAPVLLTKQSSVVTEVCSKDDREDLSTAIDPPTSDIVPPGERAECDTGPRAGPDDQGVAVRNPPAAKPPQNWDDTAGGKAWQAWVDAGGAHYDRWGNHNE
jgi:hypothetical protein